jgi:hypothetical protein
MMNEWVCPICEKLKPDKVGGPREVTVCGDCWPGIGSDRLAKLWGDEVEENKKLNAEKQTLEDHINVAIGMARNGPFESSHPIGVYLQKALHPRAVAEAAEKLAPLYEDGTIPSDHADQWEDMLRQDLANVFNKHSREGISERPPRKHTTCDCGAEIADIPVCHPCNRENARREFAQEAITKVPPPDVFCEDSGGSFMIGVKEMADYIGWLREQAGEFEVNDD